jgi:hypothetical protein
MKLKYIFFALGLSSLVSVTGFSCQKKTDCIAQVIIHDSTGHVLRGANVNLFANVKTPNLGTVTADLKANGNTDGSGQVSFTFQQPAIYNIMVSYGTYTAASIIKLEVGQTVSQTVVVR